jgi:phosphomethylpyrimidine synthase
MKITEDVRKFARENALEESRAVDAGLEAKSAEFAAGGGEIYR